MMHALSPARKLASSAKTGWETPCLTSHSIRETRSDDGGNSDGVGGGIFLFDAPVKPPKGKLSISAEDRARIAEFLAAISGSPERLEAAAFNPDQAMVSAGLTRDQIRLAKGILNHLGR
jgi:hypothetical protein